MIAIRPMPRLSGQSTRGRSPSAKCNSEDIAWKRRFSSGRGGKKVRERKIGRLAALSKHAMPRGLRGNMRASVGVHAKYLQATSKQPRRIYYRGAEPSATAILANCHRERWMKNLQRASSISLLSRNINRDRNRIEPESGNRSSVDTYQGNWTNRVTNHNSIYHELSNRETDPVNCRDDVGTSLKYLTRQ